MPGPRRGFQGAYPTGQGDYPVTGVSWFEANVYAHFVGKKLPTVYHWLAAAFPSDGPGVIPASNFNEVGLARVGKYEGMSCRSGAFDLAGNAKSGICQMRGAQESAISLAEPGTSPPICSIT